jgi:hypothetical protein
MTRAGSVARRAIRPNLAWLVCLALSSCGDSQAPTTVEAPADTVPASPGGPQDSVVPPPDSTVPPPDSSGAGGPVVPPPDSSGAGGPVVPPTHVGIPLGPYHLPPESYAGAGFSGALLAARPDSSLLIVLEAARRASARILIGLTGSESRLLGEDGHFSLNVWKRRVDRFRGIDFSSYIADGTIIGHYIMDEPHDPTNWGGRTVSHADVDEMARYSKELWPSMATIIRGKPDYLKGYQYKYLDAAWMQYTVQFGPIESFISSNVQDAKASGLALVAGLNVINGGSPTSGIPGRREGKFGMSASELKAWGGALLAEPYTCAFIVWEYDSAYFSRPAIKAAFEELEQQARTYPKKSCRP